jgi:hypothetical protein
MTNNMSQSYQWLMICLNHHWYDSDILLVIGMIQKYDQSLVWFRHIISHWYDSDILSVIGMIKTYHQSLVWFRHTISHYVWIIPMTNNMSQSYQWLMICLNHTNDCWYVWIIGMIQKYDQSLVWFRHIISHWYD